jgi:transcriptional regulator with XRE-family HTH domain
VQQRLRAPDVEQRVLMACAECLAGEGPRETPATGEPDFLAALRIFRGDDGWQVEVNDPLQNRTATGCGCCLRCGSRNLSEREVLALLEKRSKRLDALGNTLIRSRRAFFEAPTGDAARAELARQGLMQKETAQAAGIPESTLSRWCSPEDGVWVSTPHGVLPLREFFGVNARVVEGSQLRKAVIIGAIVEARATLGPETSPDSIWEWLRENGFVLDMKDRTARHYLQEARNVERVAEARRRLADDERNDVESIRGHLGDGLDAAAVARAVQYCRIYEEFKGA